MEQVEKEIIKGTIEYEITLGEDGMSVKYNNSLEADLAACSIATLITQSAKQNLKSYLKGDPKNKEAGIHLNRATHGLLWLQKNWESLYTMYLRKKENDAIRAQNGGETTELKVTTTETETGKSVNITGTVTKQDMPTEE